MTPIIIVAAVLYFLPSLIALARGKSNGTGGVIFVNLALGWTVAGWFVSFIWACSGATEADRRREEKRHAELLTAVGTAAPAQVLLSSPEDVLLYEKAVRARAAREASNVVPMPINDRSAGQHPPMADALPRQSLMPLLITVGAAICIVWLAISQAHAQQQQTRCYQSGPTQVCETKDRTSGAVTGTSRCYATGSGQTCDTQSYGSSSSSSTTIPVPNLNPPRR